MYSWSLHHFLHLHWRWSDRYGCHARQCTRRDLKSWLEEVECIAGTTRKEGNVSIRLKDTVHPHIVQRHRCQNAWLGSRSPRSRGGSKSGRSARRVWQDLQNLLRPERNLTRSEDRCAVVPLACLRHENGYISSVGGYECHPYGRSEWF
jgi:hypothetical protein